ncbi:hypothetical protein [Methylorubrum salsuginis]|uniref:Sulfotransferase family protein n=1 Tax=Methylorubrum salsuginis TaxID=414703 RepID=A0A1I4IIJ5_9HYPH|nr:hypothetical protein [Methylorubrum salsuginis]SFL53917.1 hypothetical protein SAMN04488125_11782 [Methylorubrum salsuginis]
MAPLFFIHLPKTGGTSLRHAAAQIFPADKLLMAYGRDAKTTSPFANRIMHYSPEMPIEQKLVALATHVVENDIAFFSSHMSAAYLPCYDPARAFALFRPVPDQVLSYYAFQKAQGRTSESFEAFTEKPENRNIQSKSFGIADLETVGVVGILSDYDRFVARLNERFGTTFPVLHRNKRSIVSRLTGPTLDDAARARLEALNPEDVELYRRAEARWRRDMGE